MKNIFKRGAALAAISAISFLFSMAASRAATPDKAAGLFPDPVVAKGKGFEIKRSRIEDAFIVYKGNVAARGQAIPERDRDIIESNLLQRIILTETLLGRSTADDKTKAKESTEKLLEQTKKQFPTEEAFNSQVKATGMSMEQFRIRAEEQNICELVLDRELKSKISVKDDAVKKFYDDNPAKFEQPEQVRASHILISTTDKVTKEPLPPAKKKEKEKAIRDLKARAEKGEDFGKLAKEFSEDMGSKTNGGEYTFPRGQMVREFEMAAFSLTKTNQISDVVETQFGYHIIKLSEKIPAKTVEFAKASADIKEYLIGQEFQKQLPDFLEKIKKEANVEVIAPKEKGK